MHFMDTSTCILSSVVFPVDILGTFLRQLQPELLFGLKKVIDTNRISIN